MRFIPRPLSFSSDEFDLLRQHLRASRQASHLTQGEVAERMGKPSSYISKCELGERRMDMVETRAFCQAIEKPFIEFVQEFEETLAQFEKTKRRNRQRNGGP